MRPPSRELVLRVGRILPHVRTIRGDGNGSAITASACRRVLAAGKMSGEIRPGEGVIAAIVVALTLGDAGTVVQIIGTSVQAIALLVAGVWAYYRFAKGRGFFARADFSIELRRVRPGDAIRRSRGRALHRPPDDRTGGDSPRRDTDPATEPRSGCAATRLAGRYGAAGPSPLTPPFPPVCRLAPLDDFLAALPQHQTDLGSRRLRAYVANPTEIQRTAAFLMQRF